MRKNMSIHCATPCKIAASTDKNCGNESKNQTTHKIWKVSVFFKPSLYMKFFQRHCATQYKIEASTDKNCGNESKNRKTNKIWKVRFFLQHPLSSAHQKSCFHQHNIKVVTFCINQNYYFRLAQKLEHYTWHRWHYLLH